ncbi:hypothetical protein [Nostoc sp. ChiVER01]|uniref:hypothetical protein n=1 Tax=Nostoc sp. ChiVER01 TaxID=3075382 RepID=UPI002AD3C605|nr:hypothetical protein [Nostoc sp. ChiVER01]MDZ8223767.1 hypothetical protein [Nostoc sp. ChiVER01]
MIFKNTFIICDRAQTRRWQFEYQSQLVRIPNRLVAALHQPLLKVRRKAWSNKADKG